MKLLLNTLLIYLVVSIWSFGLANAQTINIYDEYKASRRIIKEIITDNNLEKTLTGYAYRPVPFSHYQRRRFFF